MLSKIISGLFLISSFGAASGATTISCIGSSAHLKLTAKPLVKTDAFGDTMSVKIDISNQASKFERFHQLDLKSGITFRGAMATHLYADPIELILGNPTTQSGDQFPDAVLKIHQDQPKETRHEYKVSCRVSPNPTDSAPCDGKSQSDFDERLLMSAIDKSNDGVDQALSCGANVNASDRSGCTPLMLAAETNVFDCGIRSKATDSFLYNRAQAIFSSLLASGAFTVEADSRGDTALHKVIRNDGNEMLKELIGVVDDLNIQNNDGETALMMAAESGASIAVRLLLAGGANVELKNKRGLSAYDVGSRLDIDTRNMLLAPTVTQAITGQDGGTCSPQSFSLPVGKAVKLTFTSSKSKMFTLAVPGVAISLMAGAGQTVEKTVKFDKAGAYSFTCGPMGASQMTGKITVK